MLSKLEVFLLGIMGEFVPFRDIEHIMRNLDISDPQYYHPLLVKYVQELAEELMEKRFENS